MIDLDLRLHRGAFPLTVSVRLAGAATGVFGPSGSGKSSLLHALAGLLPVESLRLVVGGEVLVDTRAGLTPPAHRRRIGLVFQDHRLFPHLTIADNLRYGLQTPAGHGPAWQDVIDLLEIGDLLDRRPEHCSGGQRQRVALGRALLAAPRLLLLDEPLASLDRGLKRQILPYLRRIRDRWQMPLLMVSHDLEEVLSLSDELLLLANGQVAGQGDLMHLARDPARLELLHDAGLVCLMPGVVDHHADGLAWVRLTGPGHAHLACANCTAPVGSPVEVLLHPDDLILARPPIGEALSLTNRLPARILQITRSPSRCLVAVDLGADRPVLAEVAERTITALGLTIGEEILVLAKAQAVQAR